MTRTFVERMELKHPIVQAPMAGGPTTPALVAAVSEAGGLGSLGAADLAPDAIRAAIAEVRRRTSRPFAVNLFVQASGEPDRSRVDAANALLARYRAELGLETPPLRVPELPPFDAQLEAIVEARAPAFSFTFGVPSADALARLRAAGIAIVGTATTVREARILDEAGVDAIVAQGMEAGGHRGTFASSPERALVGTMALVPQVVDAVRAPVIAAGGIMDGRGVVAALALGACAAQLGTAFLACDEAGTNEAYRAALAASDDESTTITRAFSGRAARGIRNRFIDEMTPHEPSLPPFPVQNALTRDVRAAAAKAGRTDLVSLWAGQGSSMARRLPAAEIVRAIVVEIARARAAIAAARSA